MAGPWGSAGAADMLGGYSSVQARDVSAVDQRRSRECDNKSSDSGNTLKVEPKRFVDGLDGSWERKRGVGRT